MSSSAGERKVRALVGSSNAANQPSLVRGVSSAHGTRVPPHSVELEESVLGAVLLDPESIFPVIERVSADDFYRAAHRSIFEAMLALNERREPIDIVTLSQELRARGQLDASGGIEKLSSLASSAPSAANVGFYAKSVRELSMRRKLIHEATEIISDAYELDTPVETFLDGSEQRILAASEYRARRSFYRIGDVVQDSIKLVEKLYDQKEPVTGVATGFKKLDWMTAGLQPSDLVIIAARPAMGKTAFALSIAQNSGVHDKKGVAVFSLEMSKEQIVLRLLCSEARVDSSRVRTGNLAESDFPRIVEAASRIADAPVFIDDTPAQTVMELRAKARRLHREHPLSLIVVDYLQLMRSPTYSNSREQEIADISRSLKSLAKELKVPVVALSQLNRSVESRNDKRPMMSDLRESGAIEQDADIIMFIYRDEVYNPDTVDRGVAEIIIAKQRSGPIGTVRLAFAGEYTRFDNLVEDGDVYEGYTETRSVAPAEDVSPQTFSNPAGFSGSSGTAQPSEDPVTAAIFAGVSRDDAEETTLVSAGPVGSGPGSMAGNATSSQQRRLSAVRSDDPDELDDNF